MNPLEALKDRLKVKPKVEHKVGVKVIIAPPAEEAKKEEINKPISLKDEESTNNQVEQEVPIKRDLKRTEILVDKDDGKRAQDILEKIKQKRLTAVIQKNPEAPKQPLLPKPSVAPVIQEPTKKKPKRLSQDILLVEEVEEPKIDLPEGGPRLEIKDNINANKPIALDGIVEEPLKEEEIFVERPKPRKRIAKRAEKGVKEIGPEIMITIGDTPLPKRLPPPSIYDMKVSSYYMNNREIFVNFINNLFEPYKDDLLDETKGITCEEISKDTGEIGLLTHQKIVRDYMNLYTPYRGLLLYHGLGSGKTCSSIAITIAVAEGLKKSGKVIIMTPASLRRNYIEEIKKCGDLLFRKKQFWEWISIDTNPELVGPMSAALGLPQEYIRRRNGAWLVNVRKPENYGNLSASDKKSLNDQLDEMIRNKYTFINYNGLRRERFKQLTNGYEKNIFDNSIVVIDEAHNFISRIVNKVNKIAKFNEKKRGPDAVLPNSLALQLYEFLLRSENSRVVLLTGTPIINYPNEIGILYNILRGYIKTWTFNITTESNKKVSNEELNEIFSKEKVLDYYNYVPSSKTLTITRNPFGFENKITASSGYKGVTNEKKEIKDEKGIVTYEERGAITDDEFLKRMVKLLKKYELTVNANSVKVEYYTALPDTLEEFTNNFINKETGVVSNMEKFKRRILGLTSYFRSAQEELLPKYDKEFDKEIVLCPMSDYQFSIYEGYRQEERKSEKPNKKKSAGNVDLDGLFKEPSSTYKIFSRLACNFVMPRPPGRPTPAEYRVIESKLKQGRLYVWLKEKYIERKGEFDPDIQQKYDELIQYITDENLTKYENELKGLLSQYIDKYLTEDYKESIVTYLRGTHLKTIILDKSKNKNEDEQETQIIAVQQINPKADKLEKMRLEKEQKERIKAEAKDLKEKEKQVKELKKAEEKAEKEKEKAAAKLEREKRKQEEKAEKDLKKAEEKAKKAEEKELKKLEKTKKKPLPDELDVVEEKENEDNDSDAFWEERLKEPINYDEEEKEVENNSDMDKEEEMVELKGGADPTIVEENPAENFIDNYPDDDGVLAVRLDGYKDEDAILREADELEGDEILEQMGSVEYKEAIKNALRYLQLHSSEYLSPQGLETYSPKFLEMLNNIDDPENKGLHLVYSQFRSMEGIGIFSLVLEANGYSRFKIKRTGTDGWEINMAEEEMGKPCYALYTGTEDDEEREIIRNIYNGQWEFIPNNIATELRKRSSNNNMGEVIRVLMITSAGSEGINLRNTRFVHIMEPYWHPVRVEQVIGRARRICSHQNLAKELQTVHVYVYVATFTEKQVKSDHAKELRLKDVSKLPPYAPQSTDQLLLEISNIKENLTTQLLKGVKESSIDCATHAKSTSKEGLVCLSFGQPGIQDWTYNPTISQDENDTVADINKVTIDWEGREFTLKSTGKKYILRMDTREVYDYESVIRAKQVPGMRPIKIGKLQKNAKGDYEIVKDKI